MKPREPFFGPNAKPIAWQLGLGLVLAFIYSRIYDWAFADTVKRLICRYITGSC